MIFEDFDETTLTLNSQYLSSQLAVKITVIENAYLAVSIGIAAGTYTHVLVFDVYYQTLG
jgi:hypothetical protein